MAVALVDLLVGGLALRPGDEIPSEVSFAGKARPVDVAALIARGVAEEPKPKRRSSKETPDA